MGDLVGGCVGEAVWLIVDVLVDDGLTVDVLELCGKRGRSNKLARALNRARMPVPQTERFLMQNVKT